MILHPQNQKGVEKPIFFVYIPGTDLGSDSGYDINLTFAPWQ